MMKAILLLLLLALCLSAQAFLPPQMVGELRFDSPLRMADDDDQRERLTQLGYSDDELDIAARNKPSSSLDGPKVNVKEVDIDPFTLTAIGFGLIAMNFLVFANMGDGGLGGIVARVINTWDN